MRKPKLNTTTTVLKKIWSQYLFLTATDISELFDVSRPTAYNVIKYAKSFESGSSIYSNEFMISTKTLFRLYGWDICEVIERISV